VPSLHHPNFFGSDQYSLAARGHQNLAENAPTELILYRFVIYRAKAAKFDIIM